ncbi:MAG: TonB-dependent receptor plug domain-containing protein, partial [Acinetobacter sp.]
MNKQLIFKTLSISVITAMSLSTHANETTEAAVQLQTIVVTASSQAVDIKKAPASISVITSEDIEKQPVGSLAELLSKVPGVTGGISPSGDGSKIKLRGLPDNYTL